MNCRHCAREVLLEMIDLGFAPPSNAYLNEADLSKAELYLPLRVRVCEGCWLVQTEDFAEREMLFSSRYAYFSSTSTSWLNHAHRYCETITSELSLGKDSFVVEIASNDGYLLKNFVKAGIPCLGIEPTAETATKAESEGVPTLQEFFGLELSSKLGAEYPKADLIIGNNVYAHVPDINDFSLGIKNLLADLGTVTLEFPHLLNLVLDCQFDTIYHEHYSYLSLKTVSRIFGSVGLKVFRVDKLSTHGGSIRVFGCHDDDPRHVEQSVSEVIYEEEAAGLEQAATYKDFGKRAVEIRNQFVSFLIRNQRSGRVVVAYGAAAKGNTLLNYAGVKRDLLPVVFDAAPSKQNMFLPGSHLSIQAPEKIEEYNPDLIFVLPWNIAAEVSEVIASITKNNPEVWVAVPSLNRIS